MEPAKVNAVLEPLESSTTDSAMAVRLLDMIGASWMSQAICVAAELHIPDLLANGAQTLDELVIKTQCPRASLHRLLRGLASLGICFEQGDASYSLAPMGSLLRSSASSSVRSWAIWWGRHLWPVWQDLRFSVGTGRSARQRATGGQGYTHVEADPEAASIFNRAMVELTRLVADEVVRIYDFSAARRVVDLGGGYGALLITILKAYPALQGVLFDLPHAIDGTKTQVVDIGIASRCDYVAGNFFESVPSGADIYLLKSILHNWDEKHAALILDNCRRAMSTQAKLVLIERMIPEQMKDSPRERALARSDLNMLVGLGGRERTKAEFAALLASTGLRVVNVLPVAPEYTLIEGVRE